MNKIIYFFFVFSFIGIFIFGDISDNEYLFRCEVPLGALITGAGSLLSSIFGGIFGSDNTAETNATNYRIAKETNDLNYKMFHEQQDFAEDMWNRANQYNSPLEQAERLRAAGINPSAVLGSNGGSGVVASPVPSSPSAPQAVGATMMPYDYSPMFEGISRSIQSFLINENQGIENKMKSIDLAFKLQEKQQELENKKAEYNEILSRKDLNVASRNHYKKLAEQVDQNIGLIDATFNDLVAQAGLNTQVLAENRTNLHLEGKSKQLQNELQEWQNEFQKKYGNKQLEQLNAIIKEVCSQTNLNNSNAALSAAQKVESEARKQGIELDNRHKKRLQKVLEDSAKLERESLRKHVRQQGQDYWNPFRYVGTVLGGAGATAVKVFAK